MEEHRRACEGAGSFHAGPAPPEPGPTRVIAKRVIYASRRLVVPAGIDPDGLEDLFAVPSIADVPGPGTIVEAGEPVLTVFASGESSAICHARSIQQERCWSRRLGLVPMSR